MMKASNFVMTLICIAAAVSLTGGMLPEDGGSAPELYAQAGMPNPWTDQQTMAAAILAAALAGPCLAVCPRRPPHGGPRMRR